jgi:hypothetical protein
VLGGEVRVAAGRGGHCVAVRSRADPIADELRQLGETVQCHGSDDRVLAGEVAVEHRLAVLDPLGEPAGRHGVPAVGLGQLARDVADQPVPLGPLSLASR